MTLFIIYIYAIYLYFIIDLKHNNSGNNRRFNKNNVVYNIITFELVIIQNYTIS